MLPRVDKIQYSNGNYFFANISKGKTDCRLYIEKKILFISIVCLKIDYISKIHEDSAFLF